MQSVDVVYVDVNRKTGKLAFMKYEGGSLVTSVVCFPECFIPGYRGMWKRVPPPDPVFLERAWSSFAAAAAKANLAVILGTERVVDDGVFRVDDLSHECLLFRTVNFADSVGLAVNEQVLMQKNTWQIPKIRG